MKRNLFIGSTLAALLLALGVGQGILEKKADAQAKSDKIMVPRFEVDPTFPKPLPNHWYQGMSIGVGVDANDHIWIVHRPDTVNANEAAEDAKTGARFYTIRLDVSPEEVARLGAVKLVPGMPVEALIQTSPRTVMSYLIKPLHDQLARAFREK